MTRTATLLLLLSLAGTQAGAATLDPITADVDGNWNQRVQNADPGTVDLCIIHDGATSSTLGCALGVAPGAIVAIAATMTPGLSSQTIRAQARNAAGATPSVDLRSVLRGQAPTPPPPTGTVQMTIVGDPASGPWGVAAVPMDTRDLELRCYLDGTLQHTEQNAPYGFPDDGVQSTFGPGAHTIEFVFSLQGTTTIVETGTIVVFEGSPLPPTPPPTPVAPCLSLRPGSTYVCTVISATQQKCTYGGNRQLDVSTCPGIPGGKACLTMGTGATTWNRQSDGTWKGAYSSTALRLESCR